MRYNGKNFTRVINEHRKAVLEKGGSYADFSAIVSDEDPTFAGCNDTLSNRDLSKAAFSYCTFYDEVIEGTYLVDAVFKDTTFFNCRFEKCWFDRATFIRCSFSGCSFIDNHGKSSANFVNCKIRKNYESEMFACNRFNKIFPMACPENGSFIAWKAAHRVSGDGCFYAGSCIVKLRVPARAKRSSACGRKCRCSEAKVLGFYDSAGNKLPDDADVRSDYAPWFEYRVGKTVKPVNEFEEDRFEECAAGIHFFTSFQEAVDYLQ